MIIKSMSRKSPSFSQLYHYMKKGSSRNSPYDFFTQNVYARQDKDIVREFSRNARFLKARKNGNYLFHEVISITKSSQLTLEQEKQRLYDIVQQYAKTRCEHNLVAGYLHDEKSHNVHYHLMISSNEIDSSKNQRLTKYEFDRAKKETERYVLDTYPELEQDILINASNEQKKTRRSNKAHEVIRRGGRLEKKEKITQTLRDIFAQSQSMDELFILLSQHNIDMYNRGNTIGFITQSDNKKYRLKTLGLENEFKQIEALSRDSTKAQDKQQTKQQNKQASSDYEPESKNTQSEIERRKAAFKQARNERQRRSASKDNDSNPER